MRATEFCRSKTLSEKLPMKRLLLSRFITHRYVATVYYFRMKARKAAVVFIFITVMLDMLALGLIAPVLPKLILTFLGGNATSAATWLGIFGTVFALMQFFFSPVLGVLSDRFGRRPVILLSNLGLGLDYIVMALSPTIGWLFV